MGAGKNNPSATLREKVVAASGLIGRVLATAKSPCVMCSFGKDSIAVLHMVMQQRPGIKVVFHREPFQHHKYEYANRMIRDWDLHIVDYPPLQTTVQQNGDEVEIVNQYQAGNRYVYLPTGLRPQATGRTLCALDEIYHKPTGTFNYPFDMAFHGHKSVDVDPILGAVPLNSDIAQNIGSISACFPLRHFTNAEVWQYIEDHGIPIHETRYEKVNDVWRERDDKTHNPDYINACYACMSKTAGSSVYCPKIGCSVSNISSQLRRQEAPQLEYLKQ